MPKTLPLGPFAGMNNRASETRLPVPTKENPVAKLRNAVNVNFDNYNAIVYPRQGKTQVCSGTAEWVHQGKYVTVFLEGGALKQLRDDSAVVTLAEGYGSAWPGATAVGSELYVSNGTALGRVDALGNYTPWLVPRPPRNPDAVATELGGMFAGDYRVVMTWIAADGRESGCGNGVRVTVPAGGGIALSNFPTPPSHVTKLALYLTSVNGKQYFYYGEYAASTTALSLTWRECTIPLQTQFFYAPAPQDLIQFHFGRIFYWRGDRLYRTAPRRLHLQKVREYWRLDSDGTMLISMPNALYAATRQRVYRITNIDGDDPPVIETVLNCGAVKGAVCYDNTTAAYFQTTRRGVVRVTPDGLEELTYSEVAMPVFQRGTMTIIENNGAKYLVGIFQDGVQSDLADAAYNAAELARGSL